MWDLPAFRLLGVAEFGEQSLHGIATLAKIGVAFAAAMTPFFTALGAEKASRPNIVLILADDLGYADLGCFGAEKIRTPHLDALAAAGTRFTSFYVSQAVCTASRAGLMTGCHANRVGLHGALNHESQVGISPDELLLPEVFKSQGYATAAFGKWHLGMQEKFLPLQHGFDQFAGLPYSNDNGPLHPIVKGIPALPWFEGNEVVERDPDQRQFTRRLTERACAFIDQKRDVPFFLYVAHVMPHVPIHCRDEFRGKSAAGLYGDVVQELDASVGEIVGKLKEHKLDEKTWIVFASDNGPFLSYGDHAGSAKPLREGKLTAFEGGMRSPCIMAWPGRIPAGKVCDEVVSTIDLLPTVVNLLGAAPPKKKIDGVDVWPVLTGAPGAKRSAEAFAFYNGEELHAIRSGSWKLHFEHDYLTVAGPPGRGGKPANFENLSPKAMSESGVRGIASRHGYKIVRQAEALFDLSADLGETKDVSAAHPDVVARLKTLAEPIRADLGDKLQSRTGAGVRPVGKL